MGRRQKGKGRKRLASWHRNGVNPDRLLHQALHVFDGVDPTGVDVTAAAPTRVLRGKARTNRGEAA